MVYPIIKALCLKNNLRINKSYIIHVIAILIVKVDNVLVFMQDNKDAKKIPVVRHAYK